MQWLDDVIGKYTKPAEGEQPSAVSQPAPEDTPNEQFKKYVTEGFLAPALKPVKQAASKTASGFDSLFDKVIKQESQGVHRNEDGTLLTSPAGAQGITQIMPKTGKKPGYGIEPLKDDSEREYLRVGKQLLQAYTKEFDGDVRKGLAAYNFGIGNVQRRIAKHGDDWEKALPKETKNYLTKILGLAIPSAQAADWGKRNDGTQKGDGFLGPMKSKDGSVMTEFSVGVNIDGQEVEIPTFVPTLTQKELQSMLNGAGPSDAIVQKAVDHARARIRDGKSPFAQKGEKVQKVK